MGFTSEEVSGLTNIHPEALELHAVQLTLLCLPWKYLLLYTRWFDLYPGQVFGHDIVETFDQYVPVEDGGIEYVKASVDLVGDKLLRLLHKTCNLACALVIDNHPIFAWFLNLGNNYGAFSAMALVECHHVPKGKITDDITVEDKEGSIVLPQDISGQS